MKRAIAMVFLCMCIQSVPAQTARHSITDSTYQISGVEVTETRGHHAVTSTAPLHVLGREEMVGMGITDIADAMHRMPGINLRDYGGAGGMKTVSVRGFGSKHTGVSYDGVMLSDCQSGEIDLSRYSLDNVENLQLMVGDNDDIFIPARQAANASHLSINTIRLPSNDLHPHFTGQVKFGSFGYVTPFLRYEQSVSPKLAFSLSGEYTYAENDYPFTLRNISVVTEERRVNSRMNSGHGELNVAWHPDSANRVSLKLYYYDNDRQLPGQVRYYTNLCEDRLRDRNFFAQLHWLSRLGSSLSLKTMAKFNWSASDYRDPLMPNGFNDGAYWQRELYATASLLYAPTEHLSFDYSADYSFNNLNSSLKTDVRPYRHTVLQSFTAKYAGRRLTVMARLLWSLYLNDSRNGESARNMRRLSPSLSLSYRLVNNYDFFVRVSYKNIFRAPTFNENYYFHYGNPDLQPEATDQFNLGLTWQHHFGSHTTARITADGYVNHVKDKIVAMPHNMFVWTCVNIERVKSYGADFTLKFSHRFNGRHAVTADAGYSHIIAENRADSESSDYGKQLAYTPRNSASFSIGYENPWVSLSFHGYGISSRWANNEHYRGTEIDGFWDFGITAWHDFRLARHNLHVRLDLKNLFGKQYEIVSFYPMPRRNYLVTIKYNI